MLNKKAKQFLSFGKTVGSLMLVKYVGPVVIFILIWWPQRPLQGSEERPK